MKFIKSLLKNKYVRMIFNILYIFMIIFIALSATIDCFRGNLIIGYYFIIILWLLLTLKATYASSDNIFNFENIDIVTITLNDDKLMAVTNAKIMVILNHKKNVNELCIKFTPNKKT